MKIDEIKQCFISEKNYKNLGTLKQNIQNDQSSEVTIKAIVDTLIDSSAQPIQKLLAVRLVKEIMDLHMTIIVQLVSVNIIPIFEEVLHKTENSQFYFCKEPDEQLKMLGTSFVRLISECIFVWNIWYPEIQNQTSPFQLAYQKLIQKGYTFPKLFYFHSQKVKEFYLQQKGQISYVPIVYSNEIQPDFEYIKKKLDNNQYQQSDLIQIRYELQEINCKTNHQIKFIQSFEKAYKDYEKTKRFDEFQITIQSICLEYDDDTFEKLRDIDSFQKRLSQTPSKIQGEGGYSTDKLSQFLSNESVSVSISLDQSQDSDQKEKKQLTIINEKNRKIELLIKENNILQDQIKLIEIQIDSLKKLID